MFPQFNFHSTPLLILVLQGLIFAFLLLFRYRKQDMVADLFIALFLLIMAYHRIAYTIGFMGWYDTFKDTKINYFLFSVGLAVGPVIYLYVRTTLKAPFRFQPRDWWHFVPLGLLLIYRLILLVHDASQESWSTGYQGEWLGSFHIEYVMPVLNWLEYSSILLYLAFTVQLFLQYRQKIRQYFSNTYKLELNWLAIFLLVFGLLFIYDTLTDLVDAFITDLHYTNKWWAHLFYAIAIVYLGMKAYFTDLKAFQKLTFEIRDRSVPSEETTDMDYSKEKNLISNYMESEKAYLQPEFTLKDLATGTRLNIQEVSEVINSGFGVNFNEFINQYRVEEVKKRLADPRYDHLSIIAIAFDSGFNSKATFNRVFKQLCGQSPSQYKNSLAD